MATLRNSRGRGRGNVNQGPGGTPLKGWDFIQEKALSHDENMIADYADDIDTLLVFAGLFSAVLTAFLVVSLVLLQPDNTQTTVQILSLIALRIGAPSDMQLFLNETAASLPTSTSFKAPTNVATINTLWFTSLVLSLAAALFGILAKQWCREYLRWHNTILPARDNILIRQVRFEAWERWQVGAFIAFIPAFLEIALVLFLVGLLLFVPTYSKRGMTIVLSVVIGSVLLCALVLTVLPVFFRLCPFQTPTGWAFVRLKGVAYALPWYLAKGMSIVSDWVFHRVITCVSEPDWSVSLWYHARGTLEGLEKLQNWRAYGLHSVQAPELCKPAPAASDIKQACHDMSANFGEAAVDAVQTSTLFRALSWVRLGSNEDAVLAAIQESVPTIHTTNPTTHVNEKPQFLSAIHAICPTDVSAVLKMVQAYFYDIAEDSLSFRVVRRSPPINTVGFCGPFIDTTGCGIEQHHRSVCEAWANNSASLEVSHSILRSDLSALVDDWHSLVRRATHWERRAVAERIVLLLCVLRILPSDAHQAAAEAGPNLTLPLADILEDVYRMLAMHKGAYKNGLVFVCIEVCRSLGPVKFGPGCEQGEKYSIHIAKDSLFDLKRWEFLPDHECNLVSTWATLAVDIYHNTDSYEDANGRHLFVTSVSRAFNTMRLRIDSGMSVMNTDERSTPMTELLSCMVDALRWSLVHSHPNCGAYITLPWVKDIAQCAEFGYWCSWTKLRLWPNFLPVLRLLKACIDRNLIVRATAAAHDEMRPLVASEASAPEGVETPASELERLLELLGHPELPSLPDDLKVEALEVREHGAYSQSLDKAELLDVQEPDLPGEIVPEWLSSPAHAPSASTGVDVVASTRIDKVPSNGNVNVAHTASTASGDTGARLTAGEDASAAVDITSITPLPAPISSSDEHLEGTDVAIPSRPALPQPESDAPPRRGSPFSPPERLGNDSDAEPGEPRTEHVLPLSIQSSADPGDSPSFTFPPTAPSRLADSDHDSQSLERVRVANAAPSSESTVTDSQAAGGREPDMVVNPAGELHNVDAACVQEESASETGDTLVGSYEMGGDAYPLHALTLSRTLDIAAPEDTRTSFSEAAGVTAHIHDEIPRARPENSSNCGPSVPLNTSATSSANHDVPALETRGSEDIVAVPIDDTDRDLEAGPRIPSPVDEDCGEV